MTRVLRNPLSQLSIRAIDYMPTRLSKLDLRRLEKAYRVPPEPLFSLQRTHETISLSIISGATLIPSDCVARAKAYIPVTSSSCFVLIANGLLPPYLLTPCYFTKTYDLIYNA